uniref:Uncharacterized protein n=1 Tax=Pectobacterium carotovorum TaxID=554 RepID=A0A0K0MPT9_PECCA|nr:hypothetical protein [Pectobacterium carotovorum]AKG47449.1 hypothetical protein pA_00009 [Pectobacterium carotovorum]
MDKSLTKNDTDLMLNDGREIEPGETIMNVEVQHSVFTLVEEEVYRKDSNELLGSRISLQRKSWNGRKFVTVVAKHFPMSDRNLAIHEFMTLVNWAILEEAQSKLV